MSAKDKAEFLGYVDSFDSMETSISEALSEANHLTELSSSSFLSKEKMDALADLAAALDALDNKVADLKELFTEEIEQAYDKILYAEAK